MWYSGGPGGNGIPSGEWEDYHIFRKTTGPAVVAGIGIFWQNCKTPCEIWQAKLVFPLLMHAVHVSKILKLRIFRTGL